MMKNVGVNIKNWLIKVSLVMDLLRIQVYVNVISQVMLENTCIMQMYVWKMSYW